MPTYVYRCDSCSNQFELVQRMADDPIDTCPTCGSKVRRVIHPVGVVFKGSGWYINDSRSSKSNATSTAEATSTNGSGSGKDATTASSNGADAAKTSEKPAAKTAAD